ncbi:hypothetical protein GQ54DRAFT_510 [Martensiomyces pterosporus]|nr:hypothetical protein GQ54DRAFT_510 [Martensiomyces pterosporus]
MGAFAASMISGMVYQVSQICCRSSWLPPSCTERRAFIAFLAIVAGVHARSPQLLLKCLANLQWNSCQHMFGGKAVDKSKHADQYHLAPSPMGHINPHCQGEGRLRVYICALSMGQAASDLASPNSANTGGSW